MKYNRKFARSQWRKTLENQSKYPAAPPRTIRGAFGIKSSWNEWRSTPALAIN
jgi:hypothetical protein